MIQVVPIILNQRFAPRRGEDNIQPKTAVKKTKPFNKFLEEALRSSSKQGIVKKAI